MTGRFDIYTQDISDKATDRSQRMKQPVRISKLTIEQRIVSAIITPYYYLDGRHTSLTELWSLFELLQNNLMKAGNSFKLYLRNIRHDRGPVPES